MRKFLTQKAIDDFYGPMLFFVVFILMAIYG